MISSSVSDEKKEKVQVIVKCRARQMGVSAFRIEFMMTVPEEKRYSCDYEAYTYLLLKRVSPRLEFLEMIDVVDLDDYFRMEAESKKQQDD